jgi:hypothetical protein
VFSPMNDQTRYLFEYRFNGAEWGIEMKGCQLGVGPRAAEGARLGPVQGSHLCNYPCHDQARGQDRDFSQEPRCPVNPPPTLLPVTKLEPNLLGA